METREEKIRCTISLTPGTEAVISKEAKRRGITFADQVRRITDAWADSIIDRNNQVREKIVVMKDGALIPTR